MVKILQPTVTPNGVNAGTHGQFCCYAESDDGIHWHKPALGLHEFQGSKANNIVMVRQKVGNATSEPGEPAVFKDENPAASPEARYKALLPANRLPTDHRRGWLAFKSPDGLHWSPMSNEPIITLGAFDSQNLRFWDATQGQYRAYWRYVTKGGDHQEAVMKTEKANRNDGKHGNNENHDSHSSHKPHQPPPTDPNRVLPPCGDYQRCCPSRKQRSSTTSPFALPTSIFPGAIERSTR